MTTRREIVTKCGAGLAAIIAAGRAPAAFIRSMLAARNGLMAGGAKPPAPPSEYWGLCFTAESAGATIAMAKSGYPPSLTLQTSTDGVAWSPFTVGETTITLGNIGDKVYFSSGESGNITLSNGSSYTSFTFNGDIAATGSIMSLLNGATPTFTINADNCFYSLFQNCTTLISAPELPATTLSAHCYDGLFYGCSSLRSAPELFAQFLSTGSYEALFRGCSKLNRIKVHHTNSWSTNYTRNWVRGVAATGTFICPSALPHGSSDFGNGKIPTGWTVETF